ncbi:tRNA (cytosine(34)-C(5))-methyltransferase-like [Chenopodium quinoa]|uniref:tRNA (cytosine(34)-C(5))-methyltransferase-like n=1 Tax=Chenopodium quinoa TaxID=63459 RepID=UPI000B771D33|nr:tRNA (cytosine(34)-C(5))-methyltransferase-like [Chenopodium quinoa]
MGGRGRSRTQRKHFKQSRDNVWKNGSKSDASSAAADGENNSGDAERKTRENWEPLKTQNAVFEDYYKEQGIVAPEEWDDFMECLRKPLPAAFRINSSSQFCLDIRSQLEDDFVKSLQSEFTGDEAEALRPLPWYPETLAWHSEFSRKQLRKTQTLERFHEFLKLAHEIGNITRQEAVSMVPPLFLDVHPNHFVLDMCAAPGSKTFQLLEIIHRANEPGSLPTGMVVANDVDIQRSNLLIHQTKRMCTANLIVTNHEAQDFPGCRLSKFHHNSSDIQSEKGLSINQLDFDRVLCDVPCSGDGTLRKAPDIWRKWNVGMGNGLHCLQLKIAMRGISLLKVGGRMVYSTCSMNPVENEAVVAEILRRCGDSLELLDVSNELPLLVRRPGLKKWKVRDKGLWLSSYKDVPKYRRPSVLSSMFPSGRNIVDSSEDSGDHVVAEAKEDDKNEIVQPNTAPLSEVNDDEISSLPLERCMRIVPHDQNCGAFFIAVFHKHSPFPVVQEKNGENVQLLHKSEESAEGAGEIASNLNDVSEAKLCEATSVGNAETDAGSLADVPSPKLEEEVAEDQQDLDKEETSPKNVGKKRKLQTQGKWKGVDPVILFKDETVINSIKAFYGIDDSFPLNGHVVTRNNDTDSVKRIYYISKSVKEVLELNLLVGQQLKIASVGLKMFERQTSKDGNATECRYRISSEGLPVLLPYITKQILLAPIVDFKHLLQYKSIKFDALVDAELVEAASKLELGCCVVVLKEADQVSSFPIQVKSSTIAIGCWRGRSNLNVMVTGLDCKDLLERLEKRMETGNAEIAEPQNGGVNGDSNPNDTDMKEESKNDVDMKDEETVNMVEL